MMRKDKKRAMGVYLTAWMTLLSWSGCESQWRDESCHILPQVEVCEPVVCPVAEKQASSEKDCHWLDGFHYLEPPRAWNSVADAVSEPVVREKRENAVSKQDAVLTECIDINEAGESELVKLPGIGQGRAKQIIEYREKRAFKKKSEITRIKGIGKKSYRKLSAYICEIQGAL